MIHSDTEALDQILANVLFGDIEAYALTKSGAFEQLKILQLSSFSTPSERVCRPISDGAKYPPGNRFE